jgi:hypothetical protein
MIALLGACIPAPSPPPGYRPPVVESVEVSPSPARPGDEVVLTIAVSDDEVISGATAYHLTVPSGVLLPGAPTCSTDVAPGADVREAVITMTCPVPSFASNGTWVTDLRINDNAGGQFAYAGTRIRPTFEVTGGLDDDDPPRVLSYRTDPAVVDQDTVFSLIVRVSDPAQPLAMAPSGTSMFTLRKLFANNSTITCGDPSFAAVSTTETDVTFTCTPGNFGVPGRSEVGVHRGFLDLQDALGQQRQAELFVDVIPG